MSTQRYAGKAITILNHDGRCIHSRNCVLQRPDVFIANADGPWIAPDGADADRVAATVVACPSGALAFERHDGGAAESAPLVNTVHLRENGPLAVHAALNINGDAAHYRATLCRCGQSRNKPYCDGSHVSEGFEASGEPSTQESTPLAHRDGVLTISPLTDGPLLLQGNVEICSGTGRTVTRTQKSMLCRCGHSGNKPFCDGSHQRVGFKAP